MGMQLWCSSWTGRGVGLLLFVSGISTGCLKTHPGPGTIKQSDTDVVELRDQEIQIGCSMCIYKMAGSSDCELAALVDGKAYLVEGSGIDDHGDAHAADGLCNTARSAVATGRIEGGRLKVSKLVAVRE